MNLIEGNMLNVLKHKYKKISSKPPIYDDTSEVIPLKLRVRQNGYHHI